MNPPTIPRCRCAYCGNMVDVDEARTARAILDRFEEESFWEAIDALGPPALDENDYSVPRNFPVACLDCVTGAMFSLVIGPGGHSMLG
ncbi:MAG: hypothetical protein GYA24_17710 [Candidatus Lokiarchaeota archaeon]|nr:hypothetical protein [Candidatus Lokiarchaeota archaeon]